MSTMSSSTAGRITPDSEQEVPDWDLPTLDPNGPMAQGHHREEVQPRDCDPSIDYVQGSQPADVPSDAPQPAFSETPSQIKEMIKEMKDDNRSCLDEISTMITDMRLDNRISSDEIKQTVTAVVDKITDVQQGHRTQVEKLRSIISYLDHQVSGFREHLEQLQTKQEPGSALEVASFPKYKAAAPSPDKIFILTDATFEHALTLHDARLKFIKITSTDKHIYGCYLWRCVEKDGWLGFRNIASGTYLGHDGFGGLCANVKHHRKWEQFCVRHDAKNDGYVLLMGWWHKLGKIGIVGSGEKATWQVVTEGKPMVWGFIEV